MSWNYRLVKKENCYGLHEVHYDEAGEVEYKSVDPVGGAYEDVDELISDLEMMIKAAKKTKNDVLEF